MVTALTETSGNCNNYNNKYVENPALYFIHSLNHLNVLHLAHDTAYLPDYVHLDTFFPGTKLACLQVCVAPILMSLFP